MNTISKGIASAVGLALISMSAHAQLVPAAIGTAAAPNNGLFLAVWDANGTNSEIVNLGYTAAQLTLSPNVLGPDAATAPTGAFATAANPDGSGSVLQIDFGVIPQFSSLFTSANLGTTDFAVMDAVSNGNNSYLQVTAPTAPTSTTLTGTGVGTGVQNIQGELASWAGDSTVANSGVAADTTGTATWSVQSGSLKSGAPTGLNLGGLVGTALGFYNVQEFKSGVKTLDTITQFANSTGDGFWFLSSSGDLTYNVPVAPVPLPAAVWLFGSALLGLAGIGRRRSAG